MPSKTPKQARFMAAASHNPSFAKKAGISTKVAKEFNQADKGLLKKPKLTTPKPAPLLGDNRKGRLESVTTDRGSFRFKKNKASD